MRFLILPGVVALTACNFVQPEVRIGAGQGIPSIRGTADIELEKHVCGMPITAGAYTVTTKVVAGGCEFAFDKDVEVLATADYQRIPELSSATALLQSVELKITQLAFIDSTTQLALNPSQVKSASFSINGQLVGDRSTLTALPKTVVLQGAALSPLKANIDQRQPVTVRASSGVVLSDNPVPPTKMRIEYDAQPTLVLGAGEIKL